MSFTRRDFLARTGLTAAAGALLPAAVAARQRALPRPASWAGVRREFDLAPGYAHLGQMLFSSHPRQVREAIERHRRELDRHPVHYLYENRWRLESEVLAAAAEYTGADPSEIALTDSTTMGLGTLYSGLRLRPGQEAVFTAHDHFSTRESLRLRARRTGASVREISLYRDLANVSADEIVESVRRGVGPNTRVLAVTWVHSSTGLQIPLRRIADAVAEINGARDEPDRVLLCVDGVHAFGMEDVDLPDLGCDFFVAGTHKWLFGPRGTGLVWGRAGAWAAAVPSIPTFTGDGTPGGAMTPGGFHTYEHRWALKEAFDFHKRVGRDRVAARVRELAARLKDGLAGIERVTLRTPRAPELSAGIVCFEVDGVDSEAVVEQLWQRRVIGSRSPYSGHFVRFSPTVVNSTADVDRALREVRRVAAGPRGA